MRVRHSSAVSGVMPSSGEWPARPAYCPSRIERGRFELLRSWWSQLRVQQMLSDFLGEIRARTLTNPVQHQVRDRGGTGARGDARIQRVPARVRTHVRIVLLKALQVIPVNCRLPSVQEPCGCEHLGAGLNPCDLRPKRILTSQPGEEALVAGNGLWIKAREHEERGSGARPDGSFAVSTVSRFEAGTGPPSAESRLHSNRVLWESQLAMWSGSRSSASPRYENCGVRIAPMRCGDDWEGAADGGRVESSERGFRVRTERRLIGQSLGAALSGGPLLRLPHWDVRGWQRRLIEHEVAALLGDHHHGRIGVAAHD